MDIFNLDECLFCDGTCICWAYELKPGRPVIIANLFGVENLWAVVQGVDKEHSSVTLFCKATQDIQPGRYILPMKLLKPV